MFKFDFQKPDFYANGVPGKHIKQLMKKGFVFAVENGKKMIQKDVDTDSFFRTILINLGVSEFSLRTALIGQLNEDGVFRIVDKESLNSVYSCTPHQLKSFEALLIAFGLSKPGMRDELYSLDLYFNHTQDVKNAGFNLTLSEAKSLANAIKKANPNESICFLVLDGINTIKYHSTPINGKHNWKNGSGISREEFAKEKVILNRCRCGDLPRISFSPMTGFVTQCSSLECPAKSTSQSLQGSASRWEKMALGM